MSERLHCPVCARGFAESSLIDGIIPEHSRSRDRFNACLGSFLKGVHLVPSPLNPPSRVTPNPSPPTADSDHDRQRNQSTTRQQRLRERVPSSTSDSGISSSGADIKSPADNTDQSSTSVPYAPPRADGRNCGLDVTCLKEHGHHGPCAPYADKRRPPTVSEVICRRVARCILVAGHGGFCLEP